MNDYSEYVARKLAYQTRCSIAVHVEHDDERHICPLQLEVIRRGVQLWTNPGDVVLSPFMGIGSEGYVALELGRKFVGVELKASYFEQAIRNLASAATEQAADMFAEAA